MNESDYLLETLKLLLQLHARGNVTLLSLEQATFERHRRPARDAEQGCGIAG